ncbi:MAG: DinB family protein [Planctomycetota bacterium]|nr:MAG: DinB family protein [Planctomycetota bacterium]
MELRDHARHLLQFSRKFTERLLECFKTPDDWVFQIDPKVNHAMWIAGHLALVDNSFICRFRPDRGRKPEGWDRLFGFGSQPQPAAAAYPSPPEVLAYLRERRQALLEVLEEMTEDELRAPAPAPSERSPIAGAPSVGHGFLFIGYHEGLHSGQLTVAHRALGNAPVIG